MNSAPRLLVLQHLDVENPGVFRDFLAADGIAWDVVELDAGDAIPDLAAYAGLWVMGGPMDVWQRDEHPWLVDELAAIRHAVADLRLPFLGICLGHQLLAAALGGSVGPGTTEVGVMPVKLTTAGSESAYFSGLPQTLTTLQWHGAEVSTPPSGARVLARSEACAVQALAVADHAVSTQFHVEVTAATVAEWGAVPAYAQALDAVLGAGALPRFEADVARNLRGFNDNARRFYANWMRASGFQRAGRSA